MSDDVVITENDPQEWERKVLEMIEEVQIRYVAFGNRHNWPWLDQEAMDLAVAMRNLMFYVEERVVVSQTEDK